MDRSRLYDNNLSGEERAAEYRRLVNEQQKQAKSEESNIFRKALSFLPGGSILDKATRSTNVPITGGDVATEAALTLVPFGIGKALSAGKVAQNAAQAIGQNAAKPSLRQKIGKSLETRGQDLLGTQANLTRAESRQIFKPGEMPGDVMGSINRRTGLTKMDDMAQVAKGVTGPDGAFSELTRNAVGNIPGVDLGDISSLGARILADKAPLITGSQKKSLIDSFATSGAAARGGSAGSLSPLANPLDALDMSKQFREMASDIKKSATVSAKDRQLSKVYSELAKNIEDTIYKSPGIDEGLKLAAPDRAKDLLAAAASAPSKAQAKAYTKLAEEVQNIQDVPSLRSAQKDFVNLSKVNEASARAVSGAGAQLGDQMQGLGKVVQRPTNIVAMPLNAATPGTAGLLTKAGRALQGGGAESAGKSGIMSNPAVRFLAPQAAVRGGADLLGLRGEPSENTTGTTGAIDGQVEGMDPIEGISKGQSMYSREAAAMDIQNDLQRTGGDNMEKYLKLYEFLNPEGKSKEKQASVKEFSQAQSALAGVDQLSQMLQQDPGVAERSIAGQVPVIGGLLGGITGTSEYNAAANNILNSIARLNTGANMPQSEESYYRKTYLPQPGDSEATKQQKLSTLQAFFQPFTAGY